LESSVLPAFFIIARHSPENCPMNNEKAKKMAVEIREKLPEIAKKYKVKIVGNWTVAPEHVIYMVFEVDSYDAYLKISMEPLILKWIANNTSEIKMAMAAEESMKLLR
jgi:hypothetical protein